MRWRIVVMVVGLGLASAACGDTMYERIATAGLTGAASGGLIGGPVGALVGGGVGGVLGATLDESADVKLNRMARPVMHSVSGTPSEATRAAPSGAAERARLWTGDEVHSKLHDVGYQRVYSVRQQDGVYFARGEREGRAYDITVDAATGRIISSSDVGAAPRRSRSGEAGPGGMGEDQVRNALQREGYGNVSDLHREGGMYTGRAQRDGQTYNVRVDARTGRIIGSEPAQ